MAFATAGATGGRPGSPAPPGGSVKAKTVQAISKRLNRSQNTTRMPVGNIFVLSSSSVICNLNCSTKTSAKVEH